MILLSFFNKKFFAASLVFVQIENVKLSLNTGNSCLTLNKFELEKVFPRNYIFLTAYFTLTLRFVCFEILGHFCPKTYM